MPRKKAAPTEEQPKAVTPAPEAEALEAAPAPPAAPEAPPASPAIPEEPPAPSDPPQAPETPPEPSAPPQEQESAPSPPAAPETPPGPEGVSAIVTASKGLNLRAGPGFGFDVLSVLESGTLLLILDLPMGVKVPGWALVWLGETAGWVSDRHLRLLVD